MSLGLGRQWVDKHKKPPFAFIDNFAFNILFIFCFDPTLPLIHTSRLTPRISGRGA